MNSNNQHIRQIKVNNILNWGLFDVQKVIARCQTALKHDSTFPRECSWCVGNHFVLTMRIIANMLESTAVSFIILSRAVSDSPDQILMLRLT